MAGLLLDPDVAAHAVPDAWSATEWPLDALDTDTWIGSSVRGYAVDGVPAPRPTTPLRLYRGADAEHRTGMAWTTNRDRAAWFAARPLWPTPGTMWTTQAPAYALLARLDGRGEAEYVVDPYLLGRR